MRRLAAALGAVALLTALTGKPAAVSEQDDAEAVPPVPVGTDVDHQLGGVRPVHARVGIVVRDRTAHPEPDRYNICYVNGFQTQDNDPDFWAILVVSRSGGDVLALPAVRRRVADVSGPDGSPGQARVSHQRRHELGQGIIEVTVPKPTFAIERLVGARQWKLTVQHVRANRIENLADLGLGTHCSKPPGTGTEYRSRLVGEHAAAGGTRGPVQGVLEHTRHRTVVLRGGDQERTS